MSDVQAAEDGILRSYFDDLKQQGKKLILSIDGGGTKGLITLCCLKELERLAGIPLYELFDFYAGTSTGSIIAATLAKRMEVEEVIGLYKEFIQEVFDRRKLVNLWQIVIDVIHVVMPKLLGNDKKSIRLLAGRNFKYMYNHEVLWGLLHKHIGMFEDQGTKKPFTFKEMFEWSRRDFPQPKRLLITIKDTERSETLFAVNSGEGMEAFQDVPIAWAVLGSSVAPIYLEPFGSWVDGGVGSYSNPCYVATIQATRFFTQPSEIGLDDWVDVDGQQYEAKNLVHFSFGTGFVPTIKREKAALKKDEDDGHGVKYLENMHFLDWLKYVVSEQQDDANDEEVLHTYDAFCRQKDPADNMDFRRFQLVLDTDLLKADIEDGGLGSGWLDELDPDPKIRERELAMISHLHMASREPREEELMEAIGCAWGRALAHNGGEGFKSKQYPSTLVNPYWPPASPVLEMPPQSVKQPPPAMVRWRSKIRPRLGSYITEKTKFVGGKMKKKEKDAGYYVYKIK